MVLEIAINNLTKSRIDERSVKKIAAAVLREEIAGSKKAAEISIAFVGLERIRKLNKTYRKIDSPTDVLSFREEDAADSANIAASSGFLGEIIISPDQVKKNAIIGKKNEKAEMAWVVVHGVLHLLGYDHEKSADEAKKMRRKEEFYLKSAGIKSFGDL